MLREACQALERLASSQPLVLILEDLHWVDEATLDLISAIARRRTPAQLMIVATYRPMDAILSSSPLKHMKQELLVHRLCHEIAMEPLNESHVQRFLEADSLPRELASVIHRRSEGNPMFMVAMIDQLREKGLIATERGNWVLTVPLEGLDLGVPPTLQQLLEIQIERLDPKERSLVEAASVAGQKFSAWAVSAMLESDSEELCESLAARQSVIRRAGTQELADGSESPGYEFKHALYREVLYTQLRGSLRRRLHAKLAESMEALSSSAEQAFASELALHFEEARSYARAVRYLILTAGNARRRYAHDDSIRLLRHAMDLLAHVPAEKAHALKIEILERISDTLYAQGEMMQSADVDRAVVEQAAQHGFVVAQVNSLTRLARALAFMDMGRCIAVCERAAELARTQDDPLLQARAEMLAACWRIITHGWRAEDAAICMSARETIRRREEVPAYYEILYAHVQCIQGDFEGAYQTARAGIPPSIENDSLVVYLSAHSALVQALLNMGRFGELMEVLQTALDVAERNRNAPWLAIFRANLAWVKSQYGDLPDAQALAEELVREHPERGQVRTMALVTAGCAELDSAHVDRAIAYFSEAAGGGVQFFLDWYWRGIAQLGLARARLERGDEAAFLDRADALGLEFNARVALKRGKADEAREFAEKSLALEPPSAVAWKIELTASECCCALGDVEAASQHRARAAAIVEQLCDSFPHAEVLRGYFTKISASG